MGVRILAQATNSLAAVAVEERVCTHTSVLCGIKKVCVRREGAKVAGRRRKPHTSTSYFNICKSPHILSPHFSIPRAHNMRGAAAAAVIWLGNPKIEPSIYTCSVFYVCVRAPYTSTYFLLSCVVHARDHLHIFIAFKSAEKRWPRPNIFIPAYKFS
jgi:hypothetical protein